MQVIPAADPQVIRCVTVLVAAGKVHAAPIRTTGENASEPKTRTPFTLLHRCLSSHPTPFFGRPRGRFGCSPVAFGFGGRPLRSPMSWHSFNNRKRLVPLGNPLWPRSRSELIANHVSPEASATGPDRYVGHVPVRANWASAQSRTTLIVRSGIGGGWAQVSIVRIDLLLLLYRDAEAMADLLMGYPLGSHPYLSPDRKGDLSELSGRGRPMIGRSTCFNGSTV